jgi:hypothetical protein
MKSARTLSPEQTSEIDIILDEAERPPEKKWYEEFTERAPTYRCEK